MGVSPTVYRGDLVFYSQYNTVLNEAMRIQNGGNVGIGTTNPSTTLHVNGIITVPQINADASNYITISPANFQGYPPLSTNGTGSLSIGWNNSGGDGEIDFINNYPGNTTDGAGSGFYFYRRTGLTTKVLCAAINRYGTSINGALSKSSGTFDIQHPLYPNTDRHLVHSFIEGPRCDLIYRGSKTLVSGTAIININKECTYRPEDGMDDGTFEALCANPDWFLQNKTGFTRVIGSVSGGYLTITSEDPTSTDTIMWMVIAERKDPFIKQWDRTDSDGYLITQYTKSKSTSLPV